LGHAVNADVECRMSNVSLRVAILLAWGTFAKPRDAAVTTGCNNASAPQEEKCGQPPAKRPNNATPRPFNTARDSSGPVTLICFTLLRTALFAEPRRQSASQTVLHAGHLRFHRHRTFVQISRFNRSARVHLATPGHVDVPFQGSTPIRSTVHLDLSNAAKPPKMLELADFEPILSTANSY
jgi:hypothetical protein